MGELAKVFGRRGAAEIEAIEAARRPMNKRENAARVFAVMLGLRLIHAGPNKFAVAERFNEARRMPEAGGFTLDELEKTLDHLWESKCAANGR
jgi:hypothetical protein